MTGIAEKAARAVALTAREAYEAAKENCPVRTGRLKNSIKSETFGNTATVSANTDYAVFVELGTGRTAPQPFMQNALYSAAIAAPEIFLREIFGEGGLLEMERNYQND